MTLAYADVQGTILQGYRVDHARHFVLRVVDGAGAKAFLGSLVDRDSGMAQITTAARWTVKPQYFRDHRDRARRAGAAARRLPGGLPARRGRCGHRPTGR